MLQVIYGKVLLQAVDVVKETNYNEPIIQDCWSGWPATAELEGNQ